MKRIFVITALTLTAFGLFAQKNPFDQFTDMEGVTSVYISKSMLSLMPKGALHQFGNVNVANFIDKLSSILILTSEVEPIASEMLTLANRRIRNDKYELLMRVKSDDGELVNFFMKGKPESIKEMIMLVESNEGENVIMQFLGDFTLEDAKQITEGLK